MLVGTWNPRGTFEEGAQKHLNNKYKFDIVAIQERKQLGNNIQEITAYLVVVDIVTSYLYTRTR